MAQVTPMTLVAEAVGSNRVIKGQGIVSPLGNAELSLDEERDLRRKLVRQALDALTKVV